QEGSCPQRDVVDVGCRDVGPRDGGVHHGVRIEGRGRRRAGFYGEADTDLEWHMTSAPLLVAREGERLTLTLNSPESGNTLDLNLAHALIDAITDPATAEARVVIIRSEGKVFCGGGDVNAMAAAPNAPAFLAELTGVVHTFLLALTARGAPVIAVVNGAAAGA